MHGPALVIRGEHSDLLRADTLEEMRRRPHTETLVVKDTAGREITLEAGEGEHIYLPAGYDYTLVATGVKSAFFWTSGPSPRPGLVEAKDYSKQLTALRSE